MQKIIENPTTLKAVAAEIFSDSSQTQVGQWIRSGRFSVDGIACLDPNAHLKPGQTVQASARPRFLSHDLRVLFEDDHLIVLEKPEGLLSVAKDNSNEFNVHEILKRRYHNRRVFPVHRLDKETSGIMMFAYTPQAEAYFKELFFRHDIHREYLGIVQGSLLEKKGTWENYIREDNSLFMRPVSARTEGALHAITHYEVLKSKGQYSLVRFHLETGRKNQIRVHCGLMGAPIAGDKKYGEKSRFLHRMYLHAYSLGFVHPETKKNLIFKSFIPQDFFKLVPYSL